MEKRKLTIIGGGPAGCSAAIYAARSNVETLLITEDFGGQLMLTDHISNYLGFKKESGFSISEKFEEHVKDYDIDIKMEKVEKVEEKNGRFLIKTTGENVISETVIIAVGTKAKKLNAKGEKEFLNNGVGYCALCDGPLYRDQDVAVIGGGYSGTEAALYLSDIAKNVYLINAGDELTGEPITLKKVTGQDNIEVINNAFTKEFFGEDVLKGLKYEDRKTGKIKELTVDGAMIEIGREPRSDIVDFVDKTDEGKIESDNYCKTSVEGFYAAGDVSTIEEEQAIVAASDGCKAALQAVRYLKEEKDEN